MSNHEGGTPRPLSRRTDRPPDRATLPSGEASGHTTAGTESRHERLTPSPLSARRAGRGQAPTERTWREPNDSRVEL